MGGDFIKDGNIYSIDSEGNAHKKYKATKQQKAYYSRGLNAGKWWSSKSGNMCRYWYLGKKKAKLEIRDRNLRNPRFKILMARKEVRSYCPVCSRKTVVSRRNKAGKLYEVCLNCGWGRSY